jgi:hypothetical protein
MVKPAIYSTPVSKERQRVRAVFYLKMRSVDKIWSRWKKKKYVYGVRTEIDVGHPKYLEKRKSQRYFVHHKSHAERSGISH